MLVPIISFIFFLEPHEICAEQNTGEAVWRKTPAGDEAAVACPSDASGRSQCAPLWTTAAACFHCAINK